VSNYSAKERFTPEIHQSLMFLDHFMYTKVQTMVTFI